MFNVIVLFLKTAKRTILDIPRIILGFIVFVYKNDTPKGAHQSLINLFCVTGGYSNAFFSWIVSLFNKPYEKIVPVGLLGVFDNDRLEEIDGSLKRDGYYIFEKTLPDDLCDKLLKFALNEPASIRGDKVKESKKVLYDPKNLLAVRYDYDQQTLINNDDVQKLIIDPSIISVAQRYLNAKPMLDVIGMWWHTSFQKEPDSSSAQFFHFDMDRIKWLKFFIYLTDVDENSGPHAFVKGSHRNLGIPRNLRSQGYARLTDDEIQHAFGEDKIIYHLAKRGTVIAEDTRGLHKGQHVIQGDRLVLQLQFSNNLFGAYYPKCRISRFSEAVNKSIDTFPRIYTNFI